MNAAAEVVIRIRYAECDAQGVLFNARYGELADVAATELFRHHLGGYQKLLDAGFDSQVVHYEIDWRAPLRFDDCARVTARVGQLNRRSFSVVVSFEDDATGAARAQATLVYVMVDAKSYEKRPIPDWFRVLAQADQATVRVDMSGQPPAANT